LDRESFSLHASTFQNQKRSFLRRRRSRLNSSKYVSKFFEPYLNSFYSLHSCNNLTDECASQPCQNGGSCVDGLGYYFCVCDHTRFSGVNCERIFEPCTSYQCYNNGTCVDDASQTFCLCSLGYTGPQCQFKQTCKVTCQNGGVCNSTADGCLCPTKYGGVDCSVLEDFCTVLNPCQNEGLCLSGQNSYSCACAPGWTGTNCQTALTVMINQHFYILFVKCIFHRFGLLILSTKLNINKF
jgi:hypothetical protein